ncbi:MULTISPECIES: alpha-L-fucosidase [Asticcacaulis]|uniref:alpha-L-fucosidase n=1 Tax=Asticcacaulis TaxID=76890 RepID=UPI001AE2E093|nr:MULTISPECIES: alpha-L-fucosidase [Asticcacaulis]MBP2161193.1 alpha-L-fucosidase [Asticcacaulis solisilvae]MDR6802238.1 alpha-L-fucosidase [Asticcacaulis sp. BE141]
MANLTKRTLLGAPLLAALGTAAVTASTVRAGTDTEACRTETPVKYDLPMAAGAFKPTAESLKTYQTPDWFRDAKFGIWSHWGPQAVPRMGDWYARNMYSPGHPHNTHHVKTYGHPSKFGYKDIIPLWKAEKFDPEGLMDRYAAAGAKYFVSMGVHHDNFDLWNSKHHRWNAVAMGPKRDIVGAWRDAARKRGLRFGVSEHLGASHNWFYTSHLYNQFWPDLGVPYDGADPKNVDLYHPPHNEPYRGGADTWYTTDPKFHQIWYNRIKDLVDAYEPDLLYSDGGLPFGVVGRSLVAHMYNKSIARAGRNEAVYNGKDFGSGEFYKEAFVQDVERGVLKGINPLPWQTDTSMGDWYYSEGHAYKTTANVIHMLADIVSKNGNMLLNVVQYPEGDLPPETLVFLDEMAAWMKINGEAIHGTRPWTAFGEGPTEGTSGAFQESANYTPQDMRFTTKGQALYAITLGVPQGSVAVKSLALQGGQEARKVKSVHLLGVKRPCAFRQEANALVIDLPGTPPSAHAAAFKITFHG